MHSVVAGAVYASAAGRPVVADATSVMPYARARMIAWARQYGRSAAALRFNVDSDVLVRRNAQRAGHDRVPVEDVRRQARLSAHQRASVELERKGMIGGQHRTALRDRVLDVMPAVETVEPQRQLADRLVLDQEIPPDPGGRDVRAAGDSCSAPDSRPGSHRSTRSGP
jgi:hypothetical protein